MNKIDKELLQQIANLHEVPQGSYNIRKNGESVERVSNSEIEIVTKKNKSGINVVVKPGVKNRSVHIPVIITVGNFTDLVYNDFYIGENADVTIIAGCGIHNNTSMKSEHNGIHTFHIKSNARVKYIEKHLGVGIGLGEKVLNPITKIYMEEHSFCEMETVQLGGVSRSDRVTFATLKDNATLFIKEKILTTNEQTAKTKFNVKLNGVNSSCKVLSRSVAKNNSKQNFISNMDGNNECFGHVECDGILIDKAQIISVPKINAKNVNATLVHEAAIGKIAGDQLVKLMTLGLSEKEAEEFIIKGFLN